MTAEEDAKAAEQLVMSLISKQIEDLSSALQDSRVERRRQIESVRSDLKDGLNTVHTRISDNDTRINRRINALDTRQRNLEISHAARVSSCRPRKEYWSGDWGSVSFSKQQYAKGFVAVVLVIVTGVVLGVGIYKWGPEFIRAFSKKSVPSEVVHTK